MPEETKTQAEQYIFKELETLNKKVAGTKGLPKDLETKLLQMLDRLNRMAKLGHYAAEFDTLARYIETITLIPWLERTEDNLDLKKTREVLDKNHHGMDYVKERILEYLATMILVKKRSEQPEKAFARAPILLFVGLQGIGKTTMAMSMAEALGRKYVRIATGALGTPFELRGRSKTFSEAEPGQIIKALINTGVRNPLILLDEIDKTSGEQGLRMDIMATLLEILDPNQNVDFKDHYVDYPFDLSDVLFVCSANNTGTITTALMDRMEIIKMPSYTDDEKIVISRDYLLPKAIEKAGLKDEELQIDPNLWPNIVRPFGYDSGIRSLNRTLESITRKVAKEIVDGKSDKVYITEENLKYYLPK
jgi:ATP-dependent Lon protease